MQRIVFFIFLNLALVALLSAVASSPVAAQDKNAVADKPYPINIGVGQAVNICDTGTVICPVRFTTCADTSIAKIRDSSSGPEIVGVNPGKTVCYTMSANAVRFAYSVTVR